MSGLALRELWISFRLLTLLGALLAGGIVGALLPGFGPDPAPTAVALAVTVALAAGLAAAAVSRERQRGTAAWLAARGVPRSVLLASWLVAFAVPILLGGLAASTLAWFSVAANLLPPIDPGSYAAVASSAVAGLLPAVALGLAIGAVLRPAPAVILATITAAILAAAGFATMMSGPVLPTSGIGLLATLSALDRPMNSGFLALGSALAACGALLVVAEALFERTDL